MLGLSVSGREKDRRQAMPAEKQGRGDALSIGRLELEVEVGEGEGERNGRGRKKVGV